MFGTSWIARRNFSQICLQWYTDLLKPCLALKQNEFLNFTYGRTMNFSFILGWWVSDLAWVSSTLTANKSVGNILGPMTLSKTLVGLKQCRHAGLWLQHLVSIHGIFQVNHEIIICSSCTWFAEWNLSTAGRKLHASWTCLSRPTWLTSSSLV